jgi:hypothetical protein
MNTADLLLNSTAVGISESKFVVSLNEEERLKLILSAFSLVKDYLVIDLPRLIYHGRSPNFDALLLCAALEFPRWK